MAVNFIGSSLGYVAGAASVLGSMYGGLLLGNSLVPRITQETPELLEFEGATRVIDKIAFLAKIILGSAAIGSAIGAALGLIPSLGLTFYSGGLSFAGSFVVRGTALGLVAGLLAGSCFFGDIAYKAGKSHTANF